MDNLDPGMLQYLAQALAGGQPDAQQAPDMPPMQLAGGRTLFPEQPPNAAPDKDALAAGLARPYLPQSLAPQGEPPPDMLPVPTTGPYGAPAVTRDGPRSMNETAPQSQDQVASNVGMVPPGMQPQGQPPQAAPPQDQGEEDNPYTATLRYQHDQANKTYARAEALARQAAAAGQDPSPYIEAAMAANKVAEQIRKEDREYLKSKLPKDAPQVLHEGDAIKDPQTGAWTVPIPKAEKGPASVQEWEYSQTHPGYDAFRMEKTNAAKQTESLLGNDGQPLDPNLTGPDVLKSVPPQVARMSQAMIEGRTPIPNLTVRTDPVTRQAVLAAQAADSELNVGDSGSRVRVLNEFKAGGPSSPAARMTAGNNAINHIDEANYYAQQLHDLGFDVANAAANAMTSGSSPVGKALSGYKTAVKNFAGEVVKFNTGSEGSLQDREEMMQLFSPNLTAGERKTAMESQIGILSSNMASLQTRWRQGMGPLVPMFETIHPDAKQSIERIKGNAPYPPPGGLPPSMRGESPAPQAAPQVTQAPAQQAPAASGDPLAAARDAISRGAPRDAVIQRLKQNGINAGGL